VALPLPPSREASTLLLCELRTCGGFCERDYTFASRYHSAPGHVLDPILRWRRPATLQSQGSYLHPATATVRWVCHGCSTSRSGPDAL